jgi:thymidine kinase
MAHARHFSRGSIHVTVGPMQAGKSTDLIRDIRRFQIAKKRVQIFKSALDTRYFGAQAISTHAGDRQDGVIPVMSAAEIRALVEPDTDVVAVDEVQFLDDGIVDLANELADNGVLVLLAGLPTDFRGKPFGPVPQLLAIADEVTKLTAVCMVCSDQHATRTQRLVDGRPAPMDAPTVLVGAAEAYEARCRYCHDVPPAAGHLEDEAAA